MKRLPLILSLLMIGILLLTGSAIAKNGMLKFNDKLDITGQKVADRSCKLDVELDGRMHVRTEIDLTKNGLTQKNDFPFEQHVNMQGVSGYLPHYDREFNLVGAFDTSGLATAVKDKNCAKGKPCLTTYYVASKVKAGLELVEQGNNGSYPVNIGMTLAYREGEPPTFVAISFSTDHQNLCK